jgi:hypothetical protein
MSKRAWLNFVLSIVPPALLLVAWCAFPHVNLKPFYLLIVLLVVAYQTLIWMPASWRAAIDRRFGIAARPGAADWQAEDALSQLRPFILTALFLVPPIALVMIIGHAVRKLTDKNRAAADQAMPLTNDEETIVISQCVSKERDVSESNFFLSPAFGLTMLAIFVSGLPAGFVLFLYNFLHVDPLLGYPSRDPRFISVFCIMCVYLTGLAWCISTLFFRAWFTFPLNFMSTEYSVTFNQDGIIKSSIKGWFLELLCFTWPEFFPARLACTEIAALEYRQGGVGTLSPLPDNIFKKTSWIYKVLNRLAQLTDAAIDNLGRTDYVVLKSDWKKTQRIDIKLRLWEMSANQRARVFYAIKRWAPHVIIEARAGSARGLELNG